MATKTFTQLTAVTTLAAGDELVMWNASAGAARKITAANFRATAHTWTATQTIIPTAGRALDVQGASGQDIARFRTAAAANALVLNSSGVLTQAGVLTLNKFVADSGGAAILASDLGDVPTTGDLHVVEIGTSNYLIAVFRKQGTANSATVTVLASSVLTLGAGNAGGTQVINGATDGNAVRMMSVIRKAYV